jgi:PAS domain S-box-containing protein
MNTQRIDQICYKILLPIGESLNLKKMLGRSLALYIGELDCSMGAVLLVDRKDVTSFTLTNAFSMPRNIENQPSFIALRQELLLHDFSDDIITHSSKVDKGIFYVMSISDIGLLVLYKNNGIIDDNLLKALRPINHKLGTACKACLQNTELRTTSKQFEEMANMLPGLIIELDNKYNVTYFNKRTQEIFKQIDSDEFQPQSIFDFFPDFVRDQVLDLLHRCEMGENITSGDFWMKNSRGQSFMVNFTISPIRNETSFIGFRGIAIDITKRVELEKDLQLRDRLSNAITLATQELLKSPDLSQALPNSIELFKKATGMDQVSYFKNIYDQEGVIHKVIRQTRENETNNQILSQNSYELSSIKETFILDILKRNELFQTKTKEMHTGPLKKHLQEKGVKAFITLPIFSKHRFWGFLVISNCTIDYTWSTIECDLLKLFVISIAESIERKQAADELRSLYTNILEDLKTARTIQTYMLPPWVLIDDTILFSANYTPWSTIGGDLFDCVRISPTKYILYIADISGHGIQAALTMTAVKSIINLFIRNEGTPESPSKILTQLNATLSKRLFKDNYMTMCYCLVDFETMELTSFNAGHPPLLLYNINNKETKVLDSAGSIPLGWIEDYKYEEKDTVHTSFTREDVICMLTDGVFECFDENKKELGQEKLLTLFKENVELNNSLMLPHMCHDLIQQKGYTERNDDFSFIALQAIPSPEKGTHIYKEIYSQLKQVDIVCAEIEQVVLQQIKSESIAFKTRLVISEFLSNIVEHGLTKNDSEKIAIEIHIENQVEIMIRDSGLEWNLPGEEPMLDEFLDLLNNEANERGRGIQIIYSMTTLFTRRRVHKINETTMIVSPN